MANKNIKKHLTFLVISEMQLKTTIRFHYTPTRMKKDWQGYRETGTLMYC